MSLHPKAKDLSGKTFGRLTAIEQSAERDKGGGTLWRCRCSCGNERNVRTASLTGGVTHSCGCLQREQMSERRRNGAVHGHARTAKMTSTYAIWSAMLNRCRNPKTQHFDRYGGRGITVCPRWHVFQNFLDDMGERPRGLTLERKDNAGHYEPDNCKWATRREQTRNMSSNRLLTLDGDTRCVTDWAQALGISRNTLFARIRYGWDDRRILTTPVHSDTRAAQTHL